MITEKDDYGRILLLAEILDQRFQGSVGMMDQVQVTFQFQIITFFFDGDRHIQIVKILVIAAVILHGDIEQIKRGIALLFCLFILIDDHLEISCVGYKVANLIRSGDIQIF